MSLKDKTIIGALWNGLEVFGGNIVQVVITIVLARILVPEDFGIIGLLVVFTELSRVILDSGFSQALIRKLDADQEDFTAVFYFNIICGICVYLLLYSLTPAISRFYEFPELNSIARVVFLTILINSLGIVQNAKIIKDVNFKILAKRTIIANLVAGIIAVLLAIKNFGVWALVFQTLTASLLRVILIWQFSGWMPSFSFNLKPIKKMFAFSGYLLFSGIFDAIVSNIQTLLIGKYYSKSDLGFYSQANQFSKIPSRTLTLVIKNVTFPTLSIIQDDVLKLKNSYQKIIGIAVAIVFPTMLGLMAIGENLIPFLIGEKWLESIPYFMLMCIIGAIYPLYTINQNIFLVRGNSKLYLKISIAQRLITLTALVITINISIFALVVGQVITMIINTSIIMIYSGREISYFFKDQLKDLSGIIFLSCFMFIVVYVFGIKANIGIRFLMLTAQSMLGILVFFALASICKLSVLTEFRDIFRRIKINITNK